MPLRQGLASAELFRLLTVAQANAMLAELGEEQ
jgi:hypothetical protein